ncbi:MAG: hypothetical protein JSW33_16430, partial [bacterium]
MNKSTSKIFLILILASVLFFHFCKKNSSNSDNEVDYPYLNPALSPEARAADLLSRLSLDEKVGQMTQIDRQYLADIEDINRY